MLKTLRNITVFLFILTFGSLHSYSQETGDIRLGTWITVFSPEEILYSTKSIDTLIETCEKAGINDIYLQVYRANKAYYDSNTLDNSQYKKMVESAGCDTIEYLLKKASSSGIKVHAWLNVFSISNNKNADIIKKLGESCLAVDQYGRTAFPEKEKDELDKYYIREKQLFLEPGDYRVREYLINIVKDLIKRYPGFSGIHFDYIRYPSIVPFLPGSRFYPYGVSYGYSEYNVEAFKKETGLDVKKMDRSRGNFRKWDEWRRDNITSFLKEASDEIKRVSPDAEISCTIVSSLERTYLTTFQDWTKWLDKGYADYIVVMNYTDDTGLFELSSKSILIPGYKDRIQLWIGAYLLKNLPSETVKQIDISLALSPGGIVIFSYDDIAASQTLKDYLTKKFKSENPIKN